VKERKKREKEGEVKESTCTSLVKQPITHSPSETLYKIEHIYLANLHKSRGQSKEVNSTRSLSAVNIPRDLITDISLENSNLLWKLAKHE
jgi:hypothetical protein